VFVLDGGLPKWVAEGRVTEDLARHPQERHFTPRMSYDLIRDHRQMSAILAGQKEQVLDARPAGRFEGSSPEPRPGLPSGHMPGARNLPWSNVIAPDGTLKSVADLTSIFEGAGVDINRPVVTTCGSGVTAAILALALARVGRPRTGVYDGSWAEWGSRPEAMIATGPA
jgi:thiosulfate/3-mercaptopyruvate sulfurtransferase